MPIHYPENIASRTAIPASGLIDSTLLLDVYSGGERSLSLAELKKTGLNVVNVKQYGAVGDGVADDTPSLLSGINAAISNGLSLYIPDGEYYLPAWTSKIIASGTLNVLCDNNVIISSVGTADFVGVGTSGELNWYGGRVTNFQYGFICLNASNGGTKFSLFNCEVDNCQRAIVEVGTSSGTCELFRVENCHVHDCSVFGIVNRYTQIERAIIVNNNVHDIGGSGTSANGIVVGYNVPDSSSHVIVENNLVSDIFSTASGLSEVNGILVFSQRCRINGNTITNIYATNSTDCEGIYTKSTHCIISNNVLVDAGEGGEGFITSKGDVRGGTDGTAFGFSTQILNNQILATRTSSTNNTGIYVATHDTVVAGNMINVEGSGSIYRGIACPGTDCVIRDNVIRGLKHGSASILGISIGRSDNFVTNNYISDLTSSGSGGIIGIYVQPLDGMENVVVTNNVIKSLTGGTGDQNGIGVAHAFAVSGLIINDNTITDCAKGINTAVTGTATLKNVSICRNHITDVSRSGLIVVGIWAQYIHNGFINDNIITHLNSDDFALDSRAIYLFNASSGQSADIDCSRNIITNVTHSSAPATRDRATYIQISAAMDGLVFANNLVRDCGIGYHNSGMSSVTSLIYKDNQSLSNTTHWSATTFADDAIVYGNLQNLIPSTINKVVEANIATSGSPNVLTGGETEKLFTNEGTPSKNYQLLPTAVAGLSYPFMVQSASGMRITANTGDTIRLGDKVTATAGYIESTGIGDWAILNSINNTEWMGLAQGTWTNGTWTYTVKSTT